MNNLREALKKAHAMGNEQLMELYENLQAGEKLTVVASRDNDGKAQLGFLLDFPVAIEALTRVMEYGATKYERDNWKRAGKPDAEYLDEWDRALEDLEMLEDFDALTPAASEGRS